MGGSSVAALAACALLCINVTIAQYLSSCQTPDGDGGMCVLVRECPFAQAVLKKKEHSDNDIRYVNAIRCGTLETRALVCCNAPNVTQTAKPVDPETIAGLVENRFNTREEKRELLPTDCGADGSRGPLHGERAKLFDHPWNVLIKHRTKEGDNRFHCGGVLISARYMLTAARCIMGIKKTWTVESVRVGDWDLKGADKDCEEFNGGTECIEPAQDIAIEKITIHTNYSGTQSPAVKNDIALVRLAQKVPESILAGSICLPLDPSVRQQVDLEQGQFVESGWGKTPEAAGEDYKMNYLSAGVTRDVCRSKYPHADIGQGHVCAKPNRAEDTCRGDTGGPLMYRHQGRVYLVGVASFRKQCAAVGEPAVYTNVGDLVDWVVDNLEP
uniref:CLIP domain-containing serine protease n=1 Tax=Anopheles atroparvus TaxID=41427 RepID=A0AAG5CRU8_ANOAO